MSTDVYQTYPLGKWTGKKLVRVRLCAVVKNFKFKKNT